MPDSGFLMPDSAIERVETHPTWLNSYRVVFSNEFGMTYFDIEIGTNYFKVNYCFEPLNKKMLWKIMKTDFRLLFASEEASEPSKHYVQDESNFLVYKSKQGELKRWDLFTSSGDTLVEIRGNSNIADQALITFTGYQNKFPLRITLVNSIIRLQFSLSLLSIN